MLHIEAEKYGASGPHIFSFTFISNVTCIHLLVLLTLVLTNLFFPLKEMETSKLEGKRNMKEAAMEEEDDDKEENVEEDSKRKRVLNRSGRKVSTGEGSKQPSCQVEGCSADMADAKAYHRRHKVCEFHAKALAVPIGGLQQRFCQQCSRFHQLAEFDEAKRSCRRRLAGHNERRRKNSCDSPGEGSN